MYSYARTVRHYMRYQISAFVGTRCCCCFFSAMKSNRATYTTAFLIITPTHVRLHFSDRLSCQAFDSMEHFRFHLKKTAQMTLRELHRIIRDL